MADKKIAIDVNLVGINKFSTLIELLSNHMSSLPGELVSSLADLADCEHCEIGAKELAEIGLNPPDVRCLVDGVERSGVVSANRILNRLTIYPPVYFGKDKRPELNDAGDAFEERYIYPERFSIMHDDRVVASWGGI